jgi:hypothetical protein
MPNIELHGFGNNVGEVEICIWGLIHHYAPAIENDAVMTIIPSIVIDKEMGPSRPFVRVASTDQRDRIRVVKLINEKLGLDVEWLPLGGFYEGRKWKGTLFKTSKDLIRKIANGSALVSKIINLFGY